MCGECKIDVLGGILAAPLLSASGKAPVFTAKNRLVEPVGQMQGVDRTQP